jgi:hypothetical protein
MKRVLVSVVVLAAFSSSPRVPSVRFANQPPVTIVNDRRNVPKPPKNREFVRWLYNFDGQFLRPVTRALELERHMRARGVNALDEVPDSTWFTNRIGVRYVSPDEIMNPPGAIGSPEHHKPWTIVSSKVGGLTVGFIMKDARGEKFVLKFDPRGYPEAETSAQIIVARLVWAFGFNTTDDYVAYVKRGDLQLDPKAKIKTLSGSERPMTVADLDRALARVDKQKDGSMRVLTSHYLEGKPLGGHPAEGIRADDPNDRIPHELRRDLRGAYTLFSWLDHNDLHEGQMIDMYVEDPAIAGRKYLEHYFIDFGIALGFATTKNKEPRFGHEFLIDPKTMLENLLTLGLVDRDYEHRTRPAYRGIGHYEIETYDPAHWKAYTPAYRPIYAADRFDKFWGAKIIMKFTRDQIHAAVEAARLSDPRAVEWLTDAIIARQRKTARYWFWKVNPLDGFATSGRTDARQVCFQDLAIAYAFAPARDTTYTVTSYTRTNRRIGSVNVRALDGGASCAPIQVALDDPESYTIVRIETRRPDFKGSTYVHIAQEPHSSAMRVIGIWRE